jgi:hypothetical protein
MAAAVSSYFFSPASGGAAAVYTFPHIASQLFQLINGRRQRRLPFDPHQHTAIALRIDLAAAPVWTCFSRL